MWVERFHEQEKEYNKQYGLTHKEEASARRKKNRNKINSYYREYYFSHRDHILEQRRALYKKRKETS